jgi:hypothetical protein
VIGQAPAEPPQLEPEHLLQAEDVGVEGVDRGEDGPLAERPGPAPVEGAPVADVEGGHAQLRHRRIVAPNY